MGSLRRLARPPASTRRGMKQMQFILNVQVASDISDHHLGMNILRCLNQQLRLCQAGALVDIEGTQCTLQQCESIGDPAQLSIGLAKTSLLQKAAIQLVGEIEELVEDNKCSCCCR